MNSYSAGHYPSIDICSNCDKEIGPYGWLFDKTTVCPDCGRRMIQTDTSCCEIVKLLKDIKLQPLYARTSWMELNGATTIHIDVCLGMTYDAAMFSDLLNFTYRSCIPIGIKGHGCTLQYLVNSIPNMGCCEPFTTIDSRIKELKDWCEDYKENYEAKWAVGKLAGWLD